MKELHKSIPHLVALRPERDQARPIKLPVLERLALSGQSGRRRATAEEKGGGDGEDQEPWINEGGGEVRVLNCQVGRGGGRWTGDDEVAGG
jgi:hypothetical protein